MKSILCAIMIVGLQAATLLAPTTMKRCKSVIADTKYVAKRVDCPEDATYLCFSKWWRYEFEIDAATGSCYLGYEDFGNLIVEMYSSTCPLPKLTATYTYATYPSNKDATNSVVTRGTDATSKNFQKILTTQCNTAPAASSQSAGQQDLPLLTGKRIDLSGACDAFVAITVDTTYNVANGDCLKFAAYGNLGASYISGAFLMAVVTFVGL